MSQHILLILFPVLNRALATDRLGTGPTPLCPALGPHESNSASDDAYKIVERDHKYHLYQYQDVVRSMAAEPICAQQKMLQQLLQPASGPTHHLGVQMQHPVNQQQQWVDPQQQRVLVPGGSVGVPQPVVYAAPSVVVNSTPLQADAPHIASSGYSSRSSSAGATAWVPMQQAPGVHVLAAPQPLGLGPAQDPPGILQRPAGALNGVVQAPQALVVLAPPQALGPGPMLDRPGVLQPPAVVVNTTRAIVPVQAGACYLGGSAYGSNSADPTACAPTRQVIK